MEQTILNNSAAGNQGNLLTPVEDQVKVNSGPLTDRPLNSITINYPMISRDRFLTIKMDYNDNEKSAAGNQGNLPNPADDSTNVNSGPLVTATDISTLVESIGCDRTTTFLNKMTSHQIEKSAADNQGNLSNQIAAEPRTHSVLNGLDLTKIDYECRMYVDTLNGYEKKDFYYMPKPRKIKSFIPSLPNQIDAVEEKQNGIVSLGKAPPKIELVQMQDDVTTDVTSEFLDDLWDQYSVRFICNHTGPCSLLHQAMMKKLESEYQYIQRHFHTHHNVYIGDDLSPLDTTLLSLITGINPFQYFDFSRLHSSWCDREIRNVQHFGKANHEFVLEYPAEHPYKIRLPLPGKVPTKRKQATALAQRFLEAYKYKEGDLDDTYMDGYNALEKQDWEYAACVNTFLANMTNGPDVARFIFDRLAMSFCKFQMCRRKELQDMLGVDTVDMQSWFTFQHDIPQLAQFTEFLKTNVDRAVDGFSNITGAKGIRTIILNFISFVGVCVNSRSYVSSACAFQLFLSTLGVQLLEIPECIIKLIRDLCDFEPKMDYTTRPREYYDTVEMQAGLETWMKVIPAVGGLFFVLCTAVLARNIPSTTGLDQVIRRLKDIPNAARGSLDIFTFFKDQINNILTSVVGNVVGENQLPIDPFSNLQKWLSDVTEACTMENLNKMSYDSELVSRVERLHREGMEMNESFARLRVPSSDLTVFRNAQLSLNIAVNEARRSGAGGIGPRVEPLLLHMVGATGVGKSSLSWFVLADWFKHKRGVQDEKTIYENTYYRKTGQEFWDGMTSNKEVVLYDDVGTLVDSVGKPNQEFLEAIYSANIAPFPVHMASMHEKANTFFKAKLLVWSSNREGFATPSLTNPEAVTRRIDLLVRVTVKPEYANARGELDAEKAKACLDPVSPYVFDILDKHCPNKTALATGLNYYEFREKFFEAYEMKYNNSMTLIKKIKDRITMQEGELKSTNVLKLERLLESTRNRDEETRIEVLRYDDYTFFTSRGFKFSKNEIKSTAMRRNMHKIVRITHTMRKSYLRMCTEQKTLDPTMHIDIYQLLDGDFELPWMEYDRRTDLAQSVLIEMLDKEEEIRPISLRGCYNFHGDYTAAVYAMAVAQTLVRKKLYAHGMPPEKALSFWFDWHMKELRRSGGVSSCTCSADPFEKLMSGRNNIEKIMKYRPEWSTYSFVFKSIMSALIGAIFSSAAIFLYGKFFSSPQSKDYLQFNDFVRDTEGKQYLLTVDDVNKLNDDVTSISNDKGVFLRESCESCIFSLKGCGRHTQKEFERFIEIDRRWQQRKAEEKEVIERISTESHQIVNKDTPKVAIESHQVVNKDTPKVQLENVVTMQGVVDSGCVELITKLSFNNMYRIEVFNNNMWKALGNLTFVKNREALINAHFIPTLLVNPVFRVWSVCRPTPIEFNFADCETVSAADFEDFKYRDVAIMRFPKTMMPHVDISKRFMNALEVGQFEHVPRGYLIGATKGQNNLPIMRYWCTSDIRASDAVVADEKNLDKRYRGFYEYPIETVKGDCGSLLLASDSTKKGKIMGLHFSGRDNTHYTGLAAPLSFEMIERLMNALPSVSDMSPVIKAEPIVTKLQDGIVVVPKMIGGETIPLGKVRPVFCARSSAIVPSVLHEAFTPTCAPAVLERVQTDDGVVDPRLLSLAKVGMPVIPVQDKEIREIIKNDLLNLYSQDEVTTKRIFSHEESISGADDCQFFAAICRTTSAGYGFDGPGKHKYLGSGETFVYNNAELLSKINERIDAAKAGKRVPTVWVDTLKDERRPLAKVEALKTRTFAVGQLDYNLVFRRYFGAFMNHLMENRIDVECCVGTNVYNSDWDKIAHRMKSKGAKVVAGDFSNFDGTLNADILWDVLDIMNEWYDDGEENRRIREILFCEIVHSIHTCDDQLYNWTHSQPSGNPATVIINSIYNSYVMRYAFLKSVPSELRNMAIFHRTVAMVNYGDDNVINMSDAIAPYYNQITMTEALKEIGMTYTDEAKSGQLVPYRKLDEVAFLKRTFRFDKERMRYVGPLSMDTVREMILWCKKGLDLHQNTAVNVSTALMEASYHPRSVFDEFLRQLRPHLSKLSVKPLMLSYAEYRDLNISDAIYGSGMIDFLNPRMGLLTNGGTIEKQQSLNLGNRDASISAVAGEVFTSSDECSPA